MTSAHGELSFTRAAGVGQVLARRLDGVLPILFGAITVGAISAAKGGYFPDDRAWAGLALLWLVFLVLVLRTEIVLDVTAAVYAGGLVALAGLSALSLVWTTSTTLTVLDVEKLLVYVGVVTAALLVVRRRTVPQLLAGVLVGIALVSAYALATRVFPERLGSFDPLAGYRLSAVVGYWNALGMLAGLGLLLAFAFGARARLPWSRALAAASMPLLMATFLFTFSRGAWLALVVGLVAAVALDPRRLQLLAALLVLAPWPALAAVLGYSSKSLTTTTASLAEASHEGHRLVLWLVVLSLVSAAAALALALAEDRFVPGRRERVAFAALLGAAVVGAAAFVWVDVGSPASLARRGYDAALAAPKRTGGDVSNRLFDLSANGRIELWRVAWHQFESSPIGGTGAGTYEQTWTQHRSVAVQARDAHSLYLQTMGELGIAGLAALLLCLAAPLVAAVRGRASPVVPVVFGAYVAFLVHGAVDWDWELTGVGAAGLLCGAALVLAAPGVAARGLGAAPRLAAATAALALACFAFVSLMSNVPLANAREAADRGDFSSSAAAAHRAMTWAPWSAQPWRLYGEGELAQAHIAVARKAFRTAVAKDPHDYELWIDLGISTTGAEQRRALATAVRLNPRNVSLRELRAQQLIRYPRVTKPSPPR